MEDEYDVNYDDLDGADYAALSADAEEMPIDEIFRSFSFHRLNGRESGEYGEACK